MHYLIKVNFGTLFVISIWFIFIHSNNRSPIDPNVVRQLPIFANLDNIQSRYSVETSELNFPLAFSLMVYTDADLAIRLLATIYRSHNVYCIHVDRKSPESYFSLLKDVASKLGENVIVVPHSQRIRVHWGYMSTLLADLTCARLLLKANKHWRYWINLTGQEFPLRTNWELVEAIKALNGSNLCRGSDFTEYHRKPPPTVIQFEGKWLKSLTHVALSREFLEHVHESKQAHELYGALERWEFIYRGRICADEHYFATLNNNPEQFPFPGVYTGPNIEQPEVIRYKIWRNGTNECVSGYWLRQICIMGRKHLPRLKTGTELFVNKFMAHFEPDAYDELEKWINEKVEFEKKFKKLHPTFRPTYYANLVSSRYHL